ncbi:MAG: DUF1018 domain-containing protein [Candidatus Kuenenia sp.]|nr:DUF1018 domain-containing protein [Candidatus Kuenenia hertensis]
MAKKITARQKTKIWAKADEIGMPEKQLRDIVGFVSGQRSTRALTKRQGIVLIDILEGNPPPNPLRRGTTSADPLQKKISPHSRKGKKVIARFSSLASQSQIDYIESLRIKAGYGDDDHFKNHLRKYRKVESLQELDAKKAGQLIDFLRGRKKKLEGV